MLKKIISYAVIFSILYPDLVFCMLESDLDVAKKSILHRHEDITPALHVDLIQEDENILKPSLILQDMNAKTPDSAMSLDSLDSSLSFPHSSNSSPRSDDTSKDSPSKEEKDLSSSPLDMSLGSSGSRVFSSSEEEGLISSQVLSLPPVLAKVEALTDRTNTHSAVSSPFNKRVNDSSVKKRDSLVLSDPNSETIPDNKIFSPSVFDDEEQKTSVISSEKTSNSTSSEEETPVVLKEVTTPEIKKGGQEQTSEDYTLSSSSSGDEGSEPFLSTNSLQNDKASALETSTNKEPKRKNPITPQKALQPFDEQSGLLLRPTSLDLVPINGSASNSSDFTCIPLDRDMSSFFQASGLSPLVQMFNGLSSEDKEFFHWIKFDNSIKKHAWKEISKGQWAAMLGGAVVAGFKTHSTPVMYGSATFYLEDTYNIPLPNAHESKVLSAYLILSTIPDAFPSNISLWKRAATYLSGPDVSKGRIVFTLLLAGPPSIVEPLTFATVLLTYMSLLGITGTDNEYFEAIKTYSPFYLLNSVASNYDVAWKISDYIMEWADTPWARYCAHCLFGLQPSIEANIRHCFRKTFDKLSRYVFNLSEDSPYITDLYDTISTFKTNLKGEFGDQIEEDNMDAASSFFLFRYLLSLGDEIQDLQKQVQAWYEPLKDWVNWVIGLTLIGASENRFLNLQFGTETFVGFLASANTARNWGLGVAAVGFIPLTILEGIGLELFFRDYVQHDNPHAHGSNLFPGFRKTEKGISGTIGGLTYVFPSAVLSLQMCNAWYSGQWEMLLLSAISLFAQYTVQTTLGFHETYNRKVGSGINSVYNKYMRKAGPRNDFKKDKILEVIDNMRSRIHTLPPAILQLIDQSLHTDQVEAVSSD